MARGGFKGPMLGFAGCSAGAGVELVWRLEIGGLFDLNGSMGGCFLFGEERCGWLTSECWDESVDMVRSILHSRINVN